MKRVIERIYESLMALKKHAFERTVKDYTDISAFLHIPKKNCGALAQQLFMAQHPQITWEYAALAWVNGKRQRRYTMKRTANLTTYT